MIEKGGGCRGGRRALTMLEPERQRGRRSGGRQQGGEVEAVTAQLMTRLALLIGGGLRRWPVAVGMRDGTELCNEQRQRS